MKKINLKLNETHLLEDEIIKKTITKEVEQNDSVLLVSLQGTGKTTLFDKLFGKNYYLVSPTRGLASQVNHNSDNSIDEFGDYRIVANTIISALDSLREHVEEFKYVVVDEVHKLVEYCGFAYEQINAFEKLYKYCLRQSIKLIYTTGTADALYCLESLEFYKNIKVVINVECKRQYVSNVKLVKHYNKDYIANLIGKNHINDKLQIALINSTDDIEYIKNRLECDYSLRAKALSSKSRKNEENVEIYKALVNNQILELNVLLVISWADVGINFINDNISNLYYFCDNFYHKGNIISLQQFIARSRKCCPSLYCNYPRLSNEEKILLKNISNEHDCCFNDIVLSLVEDELESQYSQINLDAITNLYIELIEKLENGLVLERSDCFKYIVKINNVLVVNVVAIKFYLYMLIFKCKILSDKDNYSDYINFDWISVLSSEYIKTSFGKITVKQYNDVLYFFDKLAKIGVKIRTQTPIK